MPCTVKGKPLKKCMAKFSLDSGLTWLRGYIRFLCVFVINFGDRRDVMKWQILLFPVATAIVGYFK